MVDRPILYELDDVRKEYSPRTASRSTGSTVIAVRDVSLTIAESEWVAFVGESGSGKSTLLNILGGLDCPTSGTVRFRGRLLAKSDLVAFRSEFVGFVFQQFYLHPSLNAVENVALGLTMTGVTRRKALPEAHAWLDRFGLADRARHRPSELSGGQQQRVAIARAMAKRPAVLIADEPTGSLDKRSRTDVLELIRQLHGDSETSVILVTHNLADAERYAERILLMDDGAVAREWTPTRLTPGSHAGFETDLHLETLQ